MVKKTTYRVRKNSSNEIEEFGEFAIQAFERARIISRTEKCMAFVEESHGSRWFRVLTAYPDGHIGHNGAKKEYYILPTDQYGQPNGQVVTTLLTKSQAILYRGYIFEDYKLACWRADA